ncbi:MAG: molybdate ABC transporter permease subunit [Proteobacteria bacterium]|nr:MAG: molybdate ABC transporter permease subunit [Pseudomonadota bacterium]
MLPTDFSPLWLSLEIASLATVCTAVLGILTARLLLSLTVRNRLIVETLILCPMVLPPTVVGYCLLLFLGRNGPLTFILPDGLLFTRTAAVLAAITVSFPLMYLSARAAFRQVDKSLVDAAHSFGAGRLRSLLTIQMPLAIPGLTAGVLLSFGRSLGEFGATLMVAGNIPSVTQTLPIALYFDVESANYSRAAVWTAIAFTTSGIIIGLINYLSERKGLS